AKLKLEDTLYLAVKEKKNRSPRMFRILKENDSYFLLCSRNAPICDCKWDTFLYFKVYNQLQRIERPFSFSLKNSLLSRLEDYKIPFPEKNIEDKDFCDLLKEL